MATKPIEDDLQQRLKGLEAFVHDTEDEFHDFLATVGLSVSSGSAHTICPINRHHWVSDGGLERHVEKCGGVPSTDPDYLLPPSHFCYQGKGVGGTIDLHTNTINSVLFQAAQRGELEYGATEFKPKVTPKTRRSEAICFSRGERLAIMKHGRGQEPVKSRLSEMTMDGEDGSEDGGNSKEKNKTQAELLIELRDRKRRRQKYRGVNTKTHKNQYDKHRELIETQMMLVEGEGDIDLHKHKHSKHS